MKRKGKRGKTQKPKQSRNHTPGLLPDLHFDFFGLFAELRDMVYDELWHFNNRVAVYYEPTRSGILAYYDGMELDESDLTDASDFAWSQELVDWRSNNRSGMPQWLLTNKVMLTDGIAQFRRGAHCNIWPMAGHHIIKDLHVEPDTAIMSLRHATSLSIFRMVFPDAWCVSAESAPFIRTLNQQVPNANRPVAAKDPHEEEIGVALYTRDSTWLNLLADNLGDTASIRILNIALGLPYTSFLRDTEVPYQGLIAACTALRKLDVELFNFMDRYGRPREVLDDELLQQFRPQFKKAMGETAEEEMTSTRSVLIPGHLNGKVLFDRRLVYTKA
jgi:hypothetical protein